MSAIRTGNCRVHEVSDQLAMSAGGTSKMVDRLEAAGYCRRVSDPGDRRSSLLRLTPARAAAFEQANRAVDEELDRLLGAPLSAA